MWGQSPCGQRGAAGARGLEKYKSKVLLEALGWWGYGCCPCRLGGGWGCRAGLVWAAGSSRGDGAHPGRAPPPPPLHVQWLHSCAYGSSPAHPKLLLCPPGWLPDSGLRQGRLLASVLQPVMAANFPSRSVLPHGRTPSKGLQASPSLWHLGHGAAPSPAPPGLGRALTQGPKAEPPAMGQEFLSPPQCQREVHGGAHGESLPGQGGCYGGSPERGPNLTLQRGSNGTSWVPGCSASSLDWPIGAGEGSCVEYLKGGQAGTQPTSGEAAGLAMGATGGDQVSPAKPPHVPPSATTSP